MTNRTSETVTKHRPARNPGGLDCRRCGCTFIGEPWHRFCGVCVEAVARELVAQQGEKS
jgi:hypothetical protein